MSSRKLPELQKKSKIVEHYQQLQANAAAAHAAIEHKTGDDQSGKGLRINLQKLTPQAKIDSTAGAMLSVTRPLQSLLGPRVSMRAAPLTATLKPAAFGDTSSLDEIKRSSSSASSSAASATAHDELSPFAYISKVKKEAESLEKEDGSAGPTAPQFVYFRPRGPYDLVQCKYEEINEQNYFTLSRKGMTHYYQGNVTFTPLDRWQHEHACFQKMMQIPFFRRFRVWKAFYFWRQHVRSKIRHSRSRSLQDNLFVLNDYLRGPLLQLRKLCTDAARWRLFKIDAHNTLSLTDFRKAQEAQKNIVVEYLTALSHEIRAIALDACQQDLRSYLANNGFKAPRQLENQLEQQKALLVFESYLSTEAAKAGKPVVSDEPEETRVPPPNANMELARRSLVADGDMSHAEKAAIRTKCQKLAKFIRLADFLVIDTLAVISLERTRDLLAYIDGSKSKHEVNSELTTLPRGVSGGAAAAAAQKKAAEAKKRVRMGSAAVPENHTLFTVELRMLRPEDAGAQHTLQGLSGAEGSLVAGNQDEEMLGFMPRLDDFQNALDTTIETTIRAVMAPHRLTTDQLFAPYTLLGSVDIEEEGGARFQSESLVLQDPVFLEIKHRMRVALAHAFTAAAEYALGFEKYRAVYLENRATNVRQYAQASVETLSELVNKFESHIKLVEGMPRLHDIGILNVDSSYIARAFLPAPQKSLLGMQEMLPTLARERSTKLLEELREVNNQISIVPSTVDEFCKLKKFMEAVSDQQDKYTRNFLFIDELYRLIADRPPDHAIRVPERDKKLFETLNQERSKVKTSLINAEERVAKNSDKFSRDLTSMIPALTKEIDEVVEELQNPMVSNINSDVDDVLTFLEDKETAMAGMMDRAREYLAFQETLGIDVLQAEYIERIESDIKIKISLWSSLRRWSETSDQWKVLALKDVDVDGVLAEVSTFTKTCAKAKRLLPDNPVVTLLRDRVLVYQNTLPVVQDLRSPYFKAHHWNEVYNLLHRQFDINDPNSTLQMLIELGAMDHKTVIAVIANKAAQEAGLNEMLDKVVQTWKGVSPVTLPVLNYKDQKDAYILGGLDDVITAQDETMVQLNTILGSSYVEPIRDEVSKWHRDIMALQEILEEWGNLQRMWMYLETIFTSPDIVRTLVEEAAMFNMVDRAWKALMLKTRDEPQALKAAQSRGLYEELKAHNAMLERVEKLLENYLESRRQMFPRFYFLPNEQLIQILSKAKDPEAIQPFLRNCFQNLVQLEFADRDIKAMYSEEGERVRLGPNLKARESVEVWLRLLEAGMVKSLTKEMRTGVIDYETQQRGVWVVDKISQVVMTVSQIYWGRDAERALTSADPKQALQDWFNKQLTQLQELSTLVRSKLAPIDRQKVVALITTDVHARDTTAQLIKDGASGISDFKWQQQLRFYWDENDECLVRQANAEFPYGYEYQGVSTRLVITPLTDRCWMTITGALHIRYGAAPAGPAGTGKTESVKDLSKAMGLFCVVINCSDQLNYKKLGQLYSGLCQTGAWTCMDEFNRIDIEVLSVVAQQLLQIRQALVQHLEHFDFQGVSTSLKSSLGVMITMNPGYAGRTELPDNLKVLFRPVSMMIPDYALIAEIMLFAEGFSDATSLSRKMVILYQLSSQQLSQQKHYDFGMRAVKSVLVMAGQLKRRDPNLNEDVLLIRAMNDANLPKFLPDDIPLFSAIVEDLFPGVNIPPVDYGELEVAIDASCDQLNLQKVPNFKKKVIQLFETFTVRFGVMVVGPTGGGKSRCASVLAMAMTMLRNAGSANERFQRVHQHILNPKCIHMGELYGEVNVLTQEWSNGLASSIMTEACQDKSQDRHWVTFDGPVDALWIENMNTVLDDNMTLILANMDRIRLKPELRMLFEVQDLAVASPATVSRCGMVYLAPSDIGHMPLVHSWLKKPGLLRSRESKRDVVGKPKVAAGAAPPLPQWLTNFIIELFEQKVAPGLDFVKAHCMQPIASSDGAMVTSLCTVFESVLTSEDGGALDWERPEAELTFRTLVEIAFMFAYTWSICAPINEESQVGMSKFVSELFQNVKPPGNIYDWFVDIDFNEQKGQWQQWSHRVTPYEYKPSTPYFSILVPTVDTVRYSHLMQALVGMDRPVFFTGTTGVGKSVIIADLFGRMQTQGVYLPVTMTFSAQTNSKQTQKQIEDSLVKLRSGVKGTLLGAPPGHKRILFIDDVNMPAVEEYGAQPPIELLRQFQDYKGFYDREKLNWKSIVDTIIVCASAPPGGGRNELTPRFVRHFSVFCLPAPSDAVLQQIFGQVVNGFMQAEPGFKPTVQKLGDTVVKSTVELYSIIKQELRPTPAKSHYTFNLRDISKVFAGMLMIKGPQCPNPDVLVRLWLHECQRCFQDRLVTPEDKNWFTRKLVVFLQKDFGLPWTHEDLFEQRQIMFADFLGSDHTYEEVPPKKNLESLLNDYLEEYNNSPAAPMKLVFFEDAIAHVARISRILRQPRGNAMLVGVGGSGKQSLTRLAAHMSEYACHQLEPTRNFGYTEFQDQIKKILMTVGVSGKHMVLLISESAIVDERFLEDINNLLNSGEVPNLWLDDELKTINEDMTAVVKRLGLPASTEVKYQTFVRTCRDCLHIVLCVSPVNAAFRERLLKFPSLLNCTTIDWYTKWPREALQSVAVSRMRDCEIVNAQLHQPIADMYVEMHLSLDDACARFLQTLRRHVYVTPTSYLDLINTYLSLLGQKRGQMEEHLHHLEVGLAKLIKTKADVAVLRVTLEELQPTLVQKTKETEVLLEEVNVESEKAEKVKVVVEVEKNEVSLKTAEVKVLQEEAAAELELAMPALRAANKALEKLSKKEISEVRAMQQPPVGVMRTLEAVLLLFGAHPDWDTAKKVMANAGFVKNLKEFERDKVKESTIKALQQYINDPSLSQERMANVSKAAASLMMWVQSIVVYVNTSKEVIPKQKKLEEMNAILSDSQAKLDEKQQALAKITAKVDGLRARMEAALAEKNSLNFRSKQTETRLQSAEKLTTGLGAEEIRWTADAAKLRHDMQFLEGDVLIAAACVSYFGAFTGDFRVELVNKWVDMCKAKNIPMSDTFRLQTVLGNPVEIRRWNLNGLPTDDVSVDSGILVQYGQRWPLMIDPQEQATKWVRNENKGRVHVTKFGQPDFIKLLEMAIRNGLTLLVEEVGEDVDPVLDPVLKKNVRVAMGRKLIRLGDQEIDYNDNFRLFMATKLSNPHYMPELSVKVTLLNFTVTPRGLEDQLLGDVLKKERADIEEKKVSLLLSLAADQAALKELEATILRKLATASGNILDDVDLIEVLSRSKATSLVITERVKETAITQAAIQEVREQYRPVAERGSVLYFVVSDISRVDPMYQYSLAYFERLFNLAIDQSEKSADLPTRLANLMTFLANSIFLNISRGLFESHKMLYAFLICSAIQRSSGDISPVEWNTFVRGPVTAKVDMRNKPLNPLPSFVSDTTYLQLAAMEESIPAFKGFLDQFQVDAPAWAASVSQFGSLVLPGQWNNLTPFRKLILIRTLAIGQLSFALVTYVCELMGADKLQAASQVKLDDVFRDTDFKTPVIFVLSQGADPTSALLRLARERNFSDKLQVISLGQGQGDNAKRLIDAARISGHWVCLQNCHLAKSWMPKLAEIVDELGTCVEGTFHLSEAEQAAIAAAGPSPAAPASPAPTSPSNQTQFAPSSPAAPAAREGETKQVHPQFRLWLSSMPSVDFPVAVLQKGLKLTTEPPRGLRANLLRSFKQIVTPDEYERSSKPEVWRKLVFGLCFFHGTIQERRKFGPLGWNKLYEFNDSDLETSVQVLRMFLDENAQTPWDSLRYMVGHINFGGRVTDDWDRRCLLSILNKFFTANILNNDYRFSPSGQYHAPLSSASDHSQVLSYIESLPANEEPEVFGMHRNADLSFWRKEGDKFLDITLGLQPRASGASAGMSPDALVESIASEIEKALPPILQRSEAGKETFVVSASGQMDSLGVFLLQEMERFRILQTVINSTLVNLQKAIKGTVVMSQQLDLMYTALLSNRVPQLWSKVAYPSLKPLAAWIVDLHARIDFLRMWLKEGEPKSFWVPGFFFPQGFMTGTLQRYARKYRVAINLLEWKFTVLDQYDRKDVAEAPVDGVLVDGLFMDGARWNAEKKVVDDSLLGVLTPGVPIIHFLPTNPQAGIDKAAAESKANEAAAAAAADNKDTAGKSGPPRSPTHAAPGKMSKAAQAAAKAEEERKAAKAKAEAEEKARIAKAKAESEKAAVAADEEKKEPESFLYECPVYKTSVRAGELSTTGHSTNFIVTVKLPSALPPDYWVLKGAALLCQPD